MRASTRVSEVGARLAIIDVLAAYCHAVDGRDRAALLDCFWEDAVDEHGSAIAGSPRDLADWLDAKMPAHDTTMHHLGTVSITLDDDAARVRSTVIAAHVGRPVDDPLANFVSAGRYDDLFTRRGDEWRIQHRKALKEWHSPSWIEAETSMGDPVEEPA